MSVLVYLETEQRTYKKTALELASYGCELAKKLGVSSVGVTFNNATPESINPCGLDKIIHIDQGEFETFTVKKYASALAEIATAQQATYVVIGSSADAKYLSGMLAAKLHAGYLPGVIDLPQQLENNWVFKRSVFTNKGFSFSASKASITLIGLNKNSFGEKPSEKAATIESMQLNPTADTIQITNTATSKGKATIADADIVVSAGRGLKGPENWHMIEELAEVLGAATACSKPVSDMGWRPHSEHVGQTGKPVATNLYIAIGISGAIQHLAGINASKVKVVINSDPEAPFFKAADYGVVGDAFTVVPELIEKLRSFKSQNA